MDSKTTLINFFLNVISIPRSEAASIAEIFQPIQYKKGAFVLRENQVNDDYVYLEEGLMRTFLLDLNGNEITTDFFTKDNVVFEVTSFFML